MNLLSPRPSGTPSRPGLLGWARPFAALLLFVTVLGTVACGGEPAPVGYGDTARHRYELGAEALADKDYLEAVKHFTFVKNKYAYSKYAALAELRIADAYYEQDKYVDAIDAYRTFIQGRPNHREVPFAMWRISMAYFEQRPSTFFLFPPSFEKDLRTTNDALRSFTRYVERFPDHEKVGEARERIRDCRRILADHELYVAGFYLRGERPTSARGRLEVVVRDFEDLDDRWLFAATRLVDVYLALDEVEQAKGVALSVRKRHPNSAEADAVARAISRAAGELGDDD